MPQLLRSLAAFDSHPVPAAPSQSPNPVAQMIPQRPAAHVGVAFGPVGHAMPHDPQLLTSPSTLTSHPVAAAPSQSVNPLLQTNLHVADEHAGDALGREGHIAPHIPQFRASLAKSASQPLAPLPSQSPKPPRHRYAHVPPLHREVALFGTGHAIPQVPQFDTSVASVDSHPSEAVELQLPNPVRQENVHASETHCARSAFGGSGHDAQVAPHESMLELLAQAAPHR
jgi:hypothetical protein